MNIRNAALTDLDSLHEIEAACFPANQAASKETLLNRLKVYPQHFWLIEEHGAIVGFINGMVTNNDTIRDEMFKDANLHTEDGDWQSVFGLAVSPVHQKRGYAGKLLEHLADVSKQNNRKGIVLTCEKRLIPLYEKYGYLNIGLSASTHGGDVFYDMRKMF